MEELLYDYEPETTLDAIKIYMNSISKIPLLTPEEEKELGKLILEGDKNALNKMVESNLRLTVSVAHKYQNNGVSFLDLIQEGNLGLMHAAEKFDYRKGYKFSTYATTWIKQYVQRAVAVHGRTIRVPVHVYEQTKTIQRAARSLSQDLKREPTIAEIAQVVDLSEEKIEECLFHSKNIYSLDKPLTNDTDDILLDTVSNEFAVSGEEVVRGEATRQSVIEILNSLDEREKNIIIMRYGFDNGQAKTLEEIGAIIGLTRERVRQLEKLALRKLRQPVRANAIKEAIF